MPPEKLPLAAGQLANNFVWACNAGGQFREVYNAARQATPPAQAAKPTASQTLTFNGKTFSAEGDCPGAGTVSVVTENEQYMLIMTNLNNVGNHTVSSRFFTEGCTSCLSVQVQDIENGKAYIATSGTVTKNGNRITVEVTVKELEAVVTGGGSAYRVSAAFTCEE